MSWTNEQREAAIKKTIYKVILLLNFIRIQFFLLRYSGYHHTDMYITLANKITFARIFNVPIFILLLLYYKNSVKLDNPNELFRYFGIIVFLLTISLDVIDGYLARKKNETTKLGSILDPIADKSLLISAFILFSGNSIGTTCSHLPVWFVLLVISRDIVLTAGALIIKLFAGTIHVQARFFGKAATFFQTAIVTIVLFRADGMALTTCIIIAAAFTLASAVQYIIDGYHQIEKV